MSDTLTGELIEKDLAARHDQLMRDFLDGVAGMCIALYRIREEQTFKAKGFGSFGDFLDQQGISRANGRLYANSGPVLMLLRASGEAHHVRHVDMLKPISRMLVTSGPRKQAPELQEKIIARQAKIVTVAAARARQLMVPLTADVVAEVAEKNFGWLPESKRSAGRRGRARFVDESAEAKLFEAIEDVRRAIRVLATSKLPAFDAVDRGGGLEAFEGFDEALLYLQDMRDA